MAEFTIALYAADDSGTGITNFDLDTIEGPTHVVANDANAFGSYYMVVTDETELEGDGHLSDTADSGSGVRDPSQQTAVLYDSATGLPIATATFVGADEYAVFSNGAGDLVTMGEVTFETASGDLKFVFSSDPLIPGETYSRDSGRDTVVDNSSDLPYDLFLPCFGRGTEILTPEGPVLVENLEAGDEVLLSDGRRKKVTWIGSRKVKLGKTSTHLRPVIVSKDAFGQNRPKKDLVLSQQHRVVVGGANADLLFGLQDVLAKAKHLIDLEGVAIDETCDEVEYWHVMFDCHELVVSNGLTSESFYVGSEIINRYDQELVQEILEIFPKLEHGDFGPEALPTLRKHEAAQFCKMH
ncbi:MAG: Hint domain-containing protein [Pseudomonadota bacterium]